MTAPPSIRSSRKNIAPAEGPLGVLLPGLGAVSTTLIAGVHLIEKGLAQPFGSVTQMQKLRLGKRTRAAFTSRQGARAAGGPRRPRLRRLGHLPGQRLRGGREGRRAAGRDALAPCGRSSRRSRPMAGRLRARLGQEPRRPPTSRRRRRRCTWPRRSSQRHRGLPRRPPARDARRDGLVRLDRGLRAAASRCTRRSPRSRRACEDNSPDIPPSMIYAYAAIAERHSVRQRRAEPLRGRPGADRDGAGEGRPDRGQGLQDRARP